MKIQRTMLSAILAAGLVFGGSAIAQEAGKSKQADDQPPAASTPKTSETKSPASDDESVPEIVVPLKEALSKLAGSYQIIAGESSGKQILPERLTDVTVRITEKTITTYDGDRHERFSANYRLNTDRRPWRIHMVSRPAAAGNGAAPAGNAGATTSEGLIELTEKGAKVIYALPSGETPKDFKTGELQQMFVLQRLPDEKDKPQGPAGPATAEGSDADR